MHKTILFIFFSILFVAGFAQPANTLNDSNTIQIKNYAVLPDHGYSFEKILADTNLPFTVNDSLRLLKASSFWVKIIVSNPFHYAAPYYLTLRPSLMNTLYFFDEDAQKWVAKDAGIICQSDKNRNQGLMLCMLQAQTKNILYVKVELGLLKQFGYPIKPIIYLNKQSVTNKSEQTIWLAWFVSLTVLLIFILNNLYIYFSFRDKTVLYYLIAQLGGLIYITSYKQFFHIILFSKIFNIRLHENGLLNYYDLDDLLNHTGVFLIMYGFVQMTRAYLNTKKTLPKLDAILKYGLYAYMLLTAMLVIINTCFSYIDEYTLLDDNIFVLLLFINILSICLVGYNRKLTSANTFLLANLLPLGFMLATTLYHIFIGFDDTSASLLPDLAITSQAMGFSVALVARIKTMRNDLATKEMEAQQLAFDIREIELRHQLIELENQQISSEMQLQKTEKELLQERLEANQRELASTTLYMEQKNKMLAELNIQIKELNKQYPDNNQHGLKEIKSILQNNLYLDADWGKFKLHFEQVHPHFFEDLQAKHPSLTRNEIRLYAYFHMKLSHKEIASLLNIDPASVRRAKTRLYKKMAISETMDNEIIDNIAIE